MQNTRFPLYLSIVVVTATVGYGIFEARNLIVGPQLTLKQPRSGAHLQDTLYDIEGHTRNVTRLSINGQSVTMGVNGAFKESRVVPDGYGVLVVEAESRFGRKVRERVEVYGTPPEHTTHLHIEEHATTSEHATTT